MDRQVVWMLNYARQNPSIKIPATATHEYLFRLIAETNVYFITLPTNKIWMVDLEAVNPITEPDYRSRAHWTDGLDF